MLFKASPLTLTSRLSLSFLLYSLPIAIHSFAVPATNMTTNMTTPNLDQARALPVPSREEILRRDPKVEAFWHNNAALLEKAWKEWERAEPDVPKLTSEVCHPTLRAAVKAAWSNPTEENEAAVKSLFKEVAPGVYQAQFFDVNKLAEIRKYFDKGADAGIPTRAPYGIVLNRKGFMLDERSPGYLAIPAFQAFYRDIMDTYMRPLGRLLFPEYVGAGDDSETFGFSIQYQAGADHSIRQHYDASTITLNINMNLPTGENWSGSSLYFIDPDTGNKHNVDFAPGVAVIHRGRIMHAAQPITSGERSNIVLWTYGRDGAAGAVRPLPDHHRLTAKERWTKPVYDSRLPRDSWAPF